LLGGYYLVTKQFAKAEQVYNSGLKLNPSDIIFQLKLAHVYMFTNRLSMAKALHKSFSNQNIESNKTWKEQVNDDFKEFQIFL
jgi:cytochrome c-type biogenesis protein CcmH/NrfG